MRSNPQFETLLRQLQWPNHAFPPSLNVQPSVADASNGVSTQPLFAFAVVVGAQAFAASLEWRSISSLAKIPFAASACTPVLTGTISSPDAPENTTVLP